MGNRLGNRGSGSGGSSHGGTESDALRMAVDSLNASEQAALKRLYQKLSTDGALDRSKMSAHFTSDVIEDYGGRLYDVLAGRGAVASELAFMAAVAKCARGTQTATIRLFWDICSASVTDSRTREYAIFCLISELGNCSLDGIADTALVLSQSMEKFNAKKRNRPITSFTSFAPDDASGVPPAPSPQEVAEAEFLGFMEWANEYTPNLSRLFVTYLNIVCFPDVELLSFTPFCPPVLEMESLVASHSRLLPLALYTNYMQGRWKRLYTTERDGVSFNRVAHNILGYGGPTCLLIQCVEGDAVFGVFSGAAWKESNRFYGNSDSFLFTLAPEFKILRVSSTTNGAYQWLNLKSYGLPHGLGVGGTTENFRFFLPDSLENGTVRLECDTFEPGRLIPKGTTFNIINLEVWGCGGDLVVEEALAAQKKDRAIRDDLIRKARTVDKAAFFENKFDQEFLLSKTFSHKVRMARRESDPTKESEESR